MAKRMVNDAEKVNDLTEYMRQENNKTILEEKLFFSEDSSILIDFYS